MERAEIVTVLQEKVAETMNVESIGEEDTFADKGVDSLAVVELVMDLEDAFGVELSEEEIAGAPTVGALVDLIRAKAS